jgi:hypothetical protein
MATPKADPGIGQENAPIGSVAWAQNVRLSMQSLVNQVDFTPDSLRRYVDMVTKHRAWTLMNKPDGSFFATWDEFCEHRQPWGLGRPWEALRPHIEAVTGKRALQLVTVAPAQSPPGKATDEDNRHDGGLLPSRTDERLRAIAERSPEPVRELYRAGLIGATEAAALGPKNPSPEEAARVTQIANDATAVARAAAPKSEPERKKVQRKVNATVREALGKTPDPVRAAAKAVASVPTQRLAELACALPLDVRRMLLMCLKDSL